MNDGDSFDLRKWKQTEIIITPNWTLGVLFLDPFDLLPEYHSEGDNWLKEIAAYYPSTGKLPAKYLKKPTKSYSKNLQIDLN